MKATLSILLGVLFVSLKVTAQVGLENYESLKILKMDLPAYPMKMTFEGIYDGQATIIINVDETGTIVDVYQESFTHPEFGRLADDSVRKWTFQPAKLNGEPVGSIKPLIFNFDDKRGVFSVSMQEAAASFLKFDKFRDSKRLYDFEDLDEGLKPEVMGQPFFPEEFKDQGIDGSATVIFYVDEAGKTRMPHLTDYSHQSFGMAALHAVENWKFKAPTVKGKPATIQVRQIFVFSDKSE
ncbi:MAG: TonB family protein [Verrucomicrobia bacterium]|nr:TonB family protein [Verrucomicrobiota bacterium]